MLLICLGSLRVDTTTAAPVAAAAQELAEQALAADLPAALSTHGLSLGPLLQLYLATLRCCDLPDPLLAPSPVASPWQPRPSSAGRGLMHVAYRMPGNRMQREMRTCIVF